MTAGGGSPLDPFEDPFDGDYEPSVAFAVTASQQADERLRHADALFQSHLGQNAAATNPVALSARKSCEHLLRLLRDAAGTCRAASQRALAHGVDTAEHAVAVREAIEAFHAACGIEAQLQSPIAAVLTPDVPPPTAPEPTLPPVYSWASVAQRTQQETLLWGVRVRAKTGQVLILHPSPSAGKTESMLELALQEQANDQRVVFAARTRDVLVDEAAPRLRAKRPFVRLHVIQGRNADTCLNFENVAAVQSHGYTPYRSVCMHCGHFPRNAPPVGLPMCDYYVSRIRAQNDSMAAKRGMNSHPIILTTHAGLISAQNSGGGHYGKFWPADYILIDEDPTESMEPEVIVTERHASFRSAKPEDRGANIMAALVREVIAEARADREKYERLGWRSAGAKAQSIHRAGGTTFAGRALHELLSRVVTGAFAQTYGIVGLMNAVRDGADSAAEPAVGALLGVTTPESANKIVPPRCLSRLAEALYDELAMIDHCKRVVYRKVRGGDMPLDVKNPRQEIADHVVPFDTAYRVRLEYGQGQWRFVVQDFASLVDHEANIVIGDAYAHVEHYRQIFGAPASKPNDPSYQDPVKTISYVARFPEGTTIRRVRVKSNISFINEDGRQEHLRRLQTVFAQFEGQRVLVYGHKSWAQTIEQLFADNDNFGVAEWAYEHWWGGRGKDGYKHYDAVVTISEPIQNFDGLLHKANARAWRDAFSSAARDPDGVLALMERIRFAIDGKSDIADQMRRPTTHWRIQQEHERQNVNEQAQALHRVRGLMAPKTMVVLGHQVELTADILAGCVEVVDPVTGVVDPDSGTGMKLVESAGTAFISAHEAYLFAKVCTDHFGVWSPSFLHAILLLEDALMLGNARFAQVTCAKCAGSQQTHRMAQEVCRSLPPFYNRYRSNYSSAPNSAEISNPQSLRALIWGRRDPLPSPDPSAAGDAPAPGTPVRLPELPPSGDPAARGTPVRLPELPPSGDPAARGTPAPGTADLPQAPTSCTCVAVAAPTLSLIERVWTPPPNWDALADVAQNTAQYKRARAQIHVELPVQVAVRPSWYRARGGRGMTVYSRHDHATAQRLALELFEDRYGPTVDGRVVAPRLRPFVPF